jgi:hypothetical protein
MSTDLIALFDVTAPDVEPALLKDQLSQGQPELASVIDRYRSRWLIQTWTCEPPGADRRSELLGPGGFTFRFEPRLIEAYHLIPFSVFARDQGARDELRRVWRLIAGLVGSRRVLYTHELMPYEGSTVKENENTLRGRVGPPAATFAELADAEPFGPRAWYLEEFSDLSP